MPLLSVVIPVLNERESLAALHRELTEVAAAHRLELDIVFVDDGSTDGSWEVIAGLARVDAGVRGIRFRRNFGKAAALSAGFQAVRGPITMTLDADLQDDPREIPAFLKTLEGGLDLVSGWKQVRHDPWHKVLPSRVFNGMVSWLTGVKLHDHNCGMKCYRSEVFPELRLYGEFHRFIPVLAAARGFKVGELVVNHRPRRFGHSKYGVRRFIKGFLDLLTVAFLTNFSRRPQHVLGGLGLLSFGVGGSGLLWLAITWVVRYFDPQSTFEPIHARALTLYSLGALLLGAQLLSMGFLAELMTALHGRAEEPYSVRERTGGGPDPEGRELPAAPRPQEPG